MSLYSIIFYFFIGLAVVSGIGILLTKNLFKGALFLLICLLSIASLYLFAFAEFVAVTQTIIYAGGVVILIIFGVMLTTKMTGISLKVESRHTLPGLLVGLALLTLLIRFILPTFENARHFEVIGNSVYKTGLNMMSAYVLPFELAGLLLLVALIGAAITSSSPDKTKKA
jgi:NADH:ubiquinone oxidoreductase subunit 6 (subunit J)